MEGMHLMHGTLQDLVLYDGDRITFLDQTECGKEWVVRYVYKVVDDVFIIVSAPGISPHLMDRGLLQGLYGRDELRKILSHFTFEEMAAAHRALRSWFDGFEWSRYTNPDNLHCHKDRDEIIDLYNKLSKQLGILPHGV